MSAKNTTSGEDATASYSAGTGSKERKSSWKIFIPTLFALLWMLCIATSLLDFFVQGSLPQWVSSIENDIREKSEDGQNAAITAQSDIFSEKDFTLIIYDKPLDESALPLYKYKIVQHRDRNSDTVIHYQDENLADASTGTVKWVLYTATDEIIAKKNETLGMDPADTDSFLRFYKLLAYRNIYSPVKTAVCCDYNGYIINAIILSLLILAGFGIPMFAGERGECPLNKEASVTVICMSVHVFFIWLCKWILREIGGGPSYYLYAMLPLSLAPALVHNLLGHRMSIYTAMLLSSLTPVLIGGTFQFQLFIQSLLYSLAVIAIFIKFRGRAQYLACFIGMTVIISVTSILFFCQKDLNMDWRNMASLWTKIPLFAMSNSLVVTALIICFTLTLERFFGLATLSRLDELNNMAHPLLKRLHDEAPGTYRHSRDVAELASDAAKRIGANPKLAEACAYFHDIGKLYAPKHYAENLSDGELNPHDACTPEESCAFLREHVKYGMKLAKQYHLPDIIREAVEQHHGDGIMAGFYAKACRDAEVAGKPVPNPELYSYRNRKAEKPEVVLVALADTCEAAIRSCIKKLEKTAAEDGRSTSELIRDEVDKLIRAKWENGQLDQAHITLENLRNAAAGIVESLCVNYHVRPEYTTRRETPEDFTEENDESTAE